MVDITEQKKCHWCAMMIPKDARGCPYCRKTQSLYERFLSGIFWAAVTFFIFMYLFFGLKP